MISHLMFLKMINLYLRIMKFDHKDSESLAIMKVINQIISL